MEIASRKNSNIPLAGLWKETKRNNNRGFDRILWQWKVKRRRKSRKTSWEQSLVKTQNNSSSRVPAPYPCRLHICTFRGCRSLRVGSRWSKRVSGAAKSANRTAKPRDQTPERWIALFYVPCTCRSKVSLVADNSVKWPFSKFFGDSKPLEHTFFVFLFGNECVTTGFPCDITVTTGFSALNCNWGKRTWKRPNLLDNCAWLGISSERLACYGKGTCHGFQSTVGSAATENRTLRELGLHTFILRTSLSSIPPSCTTRDVKSHTPWCKIVVHRDVYLPSREM